MYRRENIGFVFQFYNLIADLTVRENIKVVAEYCKNPLDIDAVMKTLGIDNLADRFPSQLSGGQQQRVAIARVVIKNPKLLLCDELTGALDSKSSGDVLKFIEKINQEFGTTIVIITHNQEIAKWEIESFSFMTERFFPMRRIQKNRCQCSGTLILWENEVLRCLH